MVVERCLTTQKLEANSLNRKRKRKRKNKWVEELSSWFKEDGRSIFLKGKILSEKDDKYMYWSIIMIPAKCFILQNYRNKTTVNMMFNHSLRHTFPVHFALPYVNVSLSYTELFDASWVVLGSVIYFFGAASENGKNDEINYLERNDVGSISPCTISFTKAGLMTCERNAPKVVALDGKIYVFGDNKDIFCEVFEPYLDSLEGQSRPISSPIPSSISIHEIQFVVAIEEERKIVLGLKHNTTDGQPTTNTVVFVYDVAGNSWVKHNANFFFNLEIPHCHPVAVGSCLYWLDTKMRAYDLNTQQCFEGPIEDCLIQQVLETSEVYKLQVSLLHLAGNFFCMTWVDCRDSTIIHCTTIQALRTTTNIKDNRFKLNATIFSCQSFASDFEPYLQDRALIL